MLRVSLGKVVHTVKRAWTYAAKVAPQELHEIAVLYMSGGLCVHHNLAREGYTESTCCYVQASFLGMETKILFSL
jgi:hypothetical protein